MKVRKRPYSPDEFIELTDKEIIALENAPAEFEPLDSFVGGKKYRLTMAGLLKIQNYPVPLPALVQQEWRITRRGQEVLKAMK